MREVEWCDGDKHIMLGLLRMATKLCITVFSSLKLTISMHGSFFKAVYGKLSKRQQYRNWCDQKFRKQEWMQV